MSHLIGYKDYNGKATKKNILADLNSFAYDPQETFGYHGHMTFHTDHVYENVDKAKEAIQNFIKGSYDDHAVYYKDKDGTHRWMVKYEYHC